MARSSREQTAATRARVLAVATDLFAARGYAAVGLEEVAAEAEVTRGAVYHHYASKQGLFAAVAAAAQHRVGAAVEAAAGSAVDWAGFLAGCRAFLTASLADDTRRILLVDAPAVLGWSVWRGQDADASGRHLEEALAALAATRVITVTSVPGTTALLSGAMNEAALHVAEDPDARLEEVWLDLLRLLEALRTPVDVPAARAKADRARRSR